MRLVIFLLCCILSIKGYTQHYTTTITNFHTRFDVAGEAIDAHDGEIAYFDGVYYLYGTSYGCGFEWGNKGAPFCGFKVYSSTDLAHWKDEGALFDATTAIWQSRCNGSTYGCFRPHVIYNKATKQYVLWINVYDNRVGFRVFTSRSPKGPFTEQAVPRLAVNADSAIAGLNNGDHDTFIDNDGTGYIAYTDWRSKGTIVIEKLTANYLSGTGEHVKGVTGGQTEAPSLFYRKGTYYITYSDPNCGYCSGTGTSYKTAPTPLGPWSEGKKISDNSCGGQPSFVSVIHLKDDVMYLYGSDLWNNAARNEALANYYWAPLEFAEDGTIKPMQCLEKATVTLAKGAAGKQLDNTTKADRFVSVCDINDTIQRTQSFTTTQSGRLQKLMYTAFKAGYPDAGLELSVTDNNGKLLSSTIIPADSISWSPKNITIFPGIAVTAGSTYRLLLKTATTKGCYGAEFSANGNGAALSSNSGASFSTGQKGTLKYQLFINKAGK